MGRDTPTTVTAVGDFGEDTTVSGSEGQYHANVSRDWEIWGPMGGYVAAMALRAAAAEVLPPFEPASFTCQFLSSAKFEPVDIAVEIRRRSRRAAAVSVRITQNSTPILDAQVWFSIPSEVVRYDYAKPHRHGRPEDHRPISEYTFEPSVFPFWENFEGRPIDWIDDPSTYPGGERAHLRVAQPGPRRAVPPAPRRRGVAPRPRRDADRRTMCVVSQRQIARRDHVAQRRVRASGYRVNVNSRPVGGSPRGPALDGSWATPTPYPFGSAS